jgi:hypothetical protein
MRRVTLEHSPGLLARLTRRYWTDDPRYALSFTVSRKNLCWPRRAAPSESVRTHYAPHASFSTVSPLLPFTIVVLGRTAELLCVLRHERTEEFLMRPDSGWPGLHCQWHWHMVHTLGAVVPTSAPRSLIYQVQKNGHDVQRPMFPFPTEDQFNHSFHHRSCRDCIPRSGNRQSFGASPTAGKGVGGRST